MTNEYILSHTPRQIAAENSHADICRALDYSPMTEEQRDAAIGSSDPYEWADVTGADQVADCERCIVSWYDMNGEEREYTAEDFAVACTLVSAAWLAYDAEHN